MARGRAQRKLAVQLQPLSDRLASQKMAQAYGLLVPATNKSVPSLVNQPETHYEQVSRDLRTSVLGSTEGGQDHRQPDDEPAGVRASAPIRCCSWRSLVARESRRCFCKESQRRRRRNGCWCSFRG